MKMTAIFADEESIFFGEKFFPQSANQHKNVLELYEMQSHTKSVVFVDKNIDWKCCHQYTVEVYQFISKV